MKVRLVSSKTLCGAVSLDEVLGFALNDEALCSFRFASSLVMVKIESWSILCALSSLNPIHDVFEKNVFCFFSSGPFAHLSGVEAG